VFGQNIDDTDCQFKYKIQLNKYSGLFMCPHLGPKMMDELNKLQPCTINKDEENKLLFLSLLTLYGKRY